MSKQDFLSWITKIRKENKGKWIALEHVVEGKLIRIKSFDTWIQVLEVDGVRFDGRMDTNARQWLEEIEKALDYVDPKALTSSARA